MTAQYLRERHDHILTYGEPLEILERMNTLINESDMDKTTSFRLRALIVPLRIGFREKYYCI